MHVELAINVTHVGLHSVSRHNELVLYLLATLALCKQTHHIELASRKTVLMGQGLTTLLDMGSSALQGAQRLDRHDVGKGGAKREPAHSHKQIPDERNHHHGIEAVGHALRSRKPLRNSPAAQKRACLQTQRLHGIARAECPKGTCRVGHTDRCEDRPDEHPGERRTRKRKRARKHGLNGREGTQHEAAKHEQRRRHEQDVLAFHAMPGKHPNAPGDQGNNHNDVGPEDDVRLLGQRDTVDEFEERNENEQPVRGAYKGIGVCGDELFRRAVREAPLEEGHASGVSGTCHH